LAALASHSAALMIPSLSIHGLVSGIDDFDGMMMMGLVVMMRVVMVLMMMVFDG